MAGKKRGVLSPEEVRGLFGELLFLCQVIEHTTEQEALGAWEGPVSVQQDFILGEMAIEVKTLSGRERNSIRISSEDQLESLKDRLFLKVFRLSEMPESDRAVSLNELVKQIADTFSDYSMLEVYYDKLAVAGYTELQEYNNQKFVVSEEHLYCVNEEFPKLIRSKVPDGVSHVHYGVEIEKIKRFLTMNDVLWER